MQLRTLALRLVDISNRGGGSRKRGYRTRDSSPLSVTFRRESAPQAAAPCRAASVWLAEGYTMACGHFCARCATKRPQNRRGRKEPRMAG